MMRRLLRGFTMAGLAAIMALGTQIAMAQEGPPRGGDNEFRGGRRGGPRGNFDPAEFQARMIQRMQEQLGSTDEEWGGIEPLLGKVMESQRAANAGRRGGGFRGPRGRPRGGGRPGGPRPGGPGFRGEGPPPGGPEGARDPEAGHRGPRPGSPGGPPPGGGRGGRGRGGRGGFGGPPPSPEAQALRATLDLPDATPKEIQAKLRDLRQANRKKQQALERSRNDLRAVLTTKQEAQLVLMGILD